MVESPEKIWVTFEPHESGKGHPRTYATTARTKGQEYVRADLYAAQLAERVREPVAASDVRDDLVERLRHRALARIATSAKNAKADAALDNEAAAEIERLREERKWARAKALEERRAANDYASRLAQALKALDDLANLSAPGWSSDTRLQLQQAVQILNQAREKAALAVRRLREGEKVDG